MASRAYPAVDRPASVGLLTPARLRFASFIAATALIATVVVGVIVRSEEPAWLPLSTELVVGIVMMVAGFVAWIRRPGSRIGPLLVVAAVLHLVWELTETPWPLVATAGFLVTFVSADVLVYALLTFPTGRTASNLERGVLIALFSVAFGLLVGRLFTDTTDSCPECPRNVALVADDPKLADAIYLAANMALAVVSVAIVVLVVRKWRAASPAARRALAPVLGVCALGGLLGPVQGAQQAWLPSLVGADIASFWVTRLLMLLSSLAFLVGLLRTRLSRAAVGDLVVELGGGRVSEGGLRDALARRLGDPTLQLAFFVAERERYVDELGHAMDLPTDGGDRAVTMLESSGEPIAALVHDGALRHDPEIVEAIAAAARLAIANARLRAEVRAQLEAVQASRVRIVEAGDAERRRVERDLHDGAQQRLVTIALDLGLLRERMDRASDPELAVEVDAISKELREAIEELRDLAHGIHPAILSEEGLVPAIESLAERSPIPVRVEGTLKERPPERIEITAYFVVAEALTNIAKYAHASRAVVRVVPGDAHLRIEIDDDGCGGADQSAGSGLRGMEDRLATLGGTLSVISPAGEGTRVRAVIPFR